jgi:hypothetical protein
LASDIGGIVSLEDGDLDVWVLLKEAGKHTTCRAGTDDGHLEGWHPVFARVLPPSADDLRQRWRLLI